RARRFSPRSQRSLRSTTSLRSLLRLEWDAPPQLVEEVLEEHDLVLLLGRFRGFHWREHCHALAVRRQIPRRAIGVDRSAVIRDPSAVGRERRELIAEAAPEKRLRLPGVQLAALLLQRHGVYLRSPCDFMVGQPLAIRRERPRNLDRLALRQRARLAGAIRA